MCVNWYQVSYVLNYYRFSVSSYRSSVSSQDKMQALVELWTKDWKLREAGFATSPHAFLSLKWRWDKLLLTGSGESRISNLTACRKCDGMQQCRPVQCSDQRNLIHKIVHHIPFVMLYQLLLSAEMSQIILWKVKGKWVLITLYSAHFQLPRKTHVPYNYCYSPAPASFLSTHQAVAPGKCLARV